LFALSPLLGSAHVHVGLLKFLQFLGFLSFPE